MNRWRRPALVTALALVLTVINQSGIGRATIYASKNQARRAQLHQAILTNTSPEAGSWKRAGANGSNIRILVPWTAELVRQLTGRSLATVYFYLESAALFAGLILVFVFLRLAAGDAAGLAGLLFTGAVLPLTYLNHYFHPWDRPSQVGWLLALCLIRLNRPGWLALLLPVAVAVKYDIVLVPLLYLATISGNNRRRVLLTTAGLLALSFGTYFALRLALPGGFEPRHPSALIADNLATMRELHLAWPPLLGLGIPLLLAVRGLRGSDRFAQAAFGLALLVLGILFAGSHFVEFRAEVPALFLLLPAAWTGALQMAGRLPEPGTIR